MPICRRNNPAKQAATAAVLCSACFSDASAWLIKPSHFSSQSRVRAHPSCAAKRCMTRDNDSGSVDIREDAVDLNYINIEDFIAKVSRVKDASTRQNNNRIGGRRLSPSRFDTSTYSNGDTIISSPSNTEIKRTAITIVAATVVSTLLVDVITMRFETVQEWRYAWPLVGTLYVAFGLSSLLPDSGSNVDDNNYYDRGILDIVGDLTRQVWSFVPLGSNSWIGCLAALAGVGVLIGGFIDAFFPVWYTSPDLLGTRAGIEADSAAILLMLTVVGIFRNISDYCSVDTSSGNGDEKIGELGSMLVIASEESLFELQFPSWALAAVLCMQLWEIASPTFYSWGELLGIVS